MCSVHARQWAALNSKSRARGRLFSSYFSFYEGFRRMPPSIRPSSDRVLQDGVLSVLTNGRISRGKQDGGPSSRRHNCPRAQGGPPAQQHGGTRAHHVVPVEPGPDVEQIGPPVLLAALRVRLQRLVPDGPASGQRQQDHQQRDEHERRRQPAGAIQKGILADVLNRTSRAPKPKHYL